MYFSLKAGPGPCVLKDPAQHLLGSDGFPKEMMWTPPNLNSPAVQKQSWSENQQLLFSFSVSTLVKWLSAGPCGTHWNQGPLQVAFCMLISHTLYFVSPLILRLGSWRCWSLAQMFWAKCSYSLDKPSTVYPKAIQRDRQTTNHVCGPFKVANSYFHWTQTDTATTCKVQRENLKDGACFFPAVTHHCWPLHQWVTISNGCSSQFHIF